MAPRAAGSRIAAWVTAARPLAHANIAPPILLGVAMGCAASRRIDGTGLALAVAFGVLDHLVIVFFNDLADEEADRGVPPTIVSGGSRVLVDGRIARADLWRAAIAAAVVLLALSGAIAATLAPMVLPLALAALALLWLYSGDPVRLSYRGGGSVLQGLGVGVVLPLVGATLQSPAAPLPLTMLAPSFLLGVAGNLLTAMPDAEADAAAGKRTLASQGGVRVAAWAAVLLISVGSVLGAATFGGSPTEAQLLTVIPLVFLTPSLLLLRGIERTRGVRLRFVLLALAAGSSAILSWTVALLTP